MYLSIDSVKIDVIFYFILKQDNHLLVLDTLYLANDLRMNFNFVADAATYFMSDIQFADFSDPKKVAKQVNGYVKEHTNNKIHDIVNPGQCSL